MKQLVNELKTVVRDIKAGYSTSYNIDYRRGTTDIFIDASKYLDFIAGFTIKELKEYDSFGKERAEDIEDKLLKKGILSEDIKGKYKLIPDKTNVFNIMNGKLRLSNTIHIEVKDAETADLIATILRKNLS